MSPYNLPYDENVMKHSLLPKPPMTEFNRDKVISANLTLGELFDSTFVTSAEKPNLEYIPIDSRVVRAFQIIRNSLGNPITVTSSFRSVAYDLAKGRTGNSQHTEGKALDLQGEGLFELLREALETKNQLYQDLRAAGVNGFGLYEKDNFVHIDVRNPKPDGGYSFWTGSDDEDLKKKSTFISTTLKLIGVSVLGIVLIVVGYSKKNKKR